MPELFLSSLFLVLPFSRVAIDHLKMTQIRSMMYDVSTLAPFRIAGLNHCLSKQDKQMGSKRLDQEVKKIAQQKKTLYYYKKKPYIITSRKD
ncbi:hypothetical protein CDAR_297261 [Caerostris darwini]|uniref:Uncharacterized protein n=1 Tax=Caerostris darwini TaxID=1538125 RepID=A0AAV4PST7_9ARAC|nr:hypothetical protein CDAR_297261 [Caerostris darwini]